MVNIFADRCLALINNISVGWHLLGVAVIIGILIFVPDDHQSVELRLRRADQQLRLRTTARPASLGFWFLVLPIGFLLTMYTQTGYDASAHTAEETRGAAIAAAQGVWRSVFFSALIGWFVLLGVPVRGQRRGGGQRRRRHRVLDLRDRAGLVGGEAGDPDRDRRPAVLRRGGADQRLAHLVRVLARPRRCPGWAIFRRVNRDRVPFNAVIAVSFFSLMIAIPALFGKNDYPFAFFALTGICTVGLYLAYIIPVYLRLRKGDAFEPGPWTLGSRYKLVNILAIIFVILVVYSLDLPYTPAGLPWNDEFDSSLVNYTPLAIVVPLIFGVWYLISAKDKYQGPVRTLEEDEVTRD